MTAVVFDLTFEEYNLLSSGRWYHGIARYIPLTKRYWFADTSCLEVALLSLQHRLASAARGVERYMKHISWRDELNMSLPLPSQHYDVCLSILAAWSRVDSQIPTFTEVLASS